MNENKKEHIGHERTTSFVNQIANYLLKVIRRTEQLLQIPFNSENARIFDRVIFKAYGVKV